MPPKMGKINFLVPGLLFVVRKHTVKAGLAVTLVSLYRVRHTVKSRAFAVCRHMATPAVTVCHGIKCCGVHLASLPCATIFCTRQRILYRAVFRQVFFTVRGTRQRLCSLFCCLCRVPSAHCNEQRSRSAPLDHTVKLCNQTYEMCAIKGLNAKKVGQGVFNYHRSLLFHTLVHLR